MNLPRSARVLALCALGALSAQAAGAGLRTRALPELRAGVEPGLVARASTSGARLHAVVRVRAGERAGLERAGVQLLQPLGGDRWLASVPADPLRRAQTPSGVLAAWELRPEDRVEPGLADRLALRGGERVALRVKLFRDGSFEAARAALAAAGATVTNAIPLFGILDVDVSASSLPVILARDDVRWVEPAPPPPSTANDGLRADAHVDEVQALGVDGTGVLIGEWDNGIADVTHPDLAGRVTAGETGLIPGGHATHVAGIAIGNGANSANQGGAPLQWRGVAPGARIVGYSVPGELTETQAAVQSFGINVSTNSWTWTVDSTNCPLYGNYASDAPEYDAIVRGQYGATLPIAFAAGNERDDGDCTAFAPGGYNTIPPPGTAKNVITVGAGYSDFTFMTSFSSWGPTDDGRMKPDVVAPGCQGSGDFGITSSWVGGGYLALCGTSMATPAVAGSIALLIQDWRALFPGDPRPATDKALLGGFAQDRGPVGPDYRFGLGAIHVAASDRALRTATTIEDQVDDGGTDEWTFRVAAGTDTLRVTLAWDDPPAAEVADTTLVNDLDLELVGPASGTHLPFVLDRANPSALATPGVNRLDDVEQVRVLAPEPGVWIARVKGTSVPLGPQLYSLVGFDNRPPADPASLAASATGDTTVAVTWVRPGDADRAGVLAVRSRFPIAWSPAAGTSYAPHTQVSPGVFVVASDDVDHSSTPLVDTPLLPGTIYHYALFAYDEIPNYSAGVSDTAKTSANAVSVPVLPSAAQVGFRRVGANPTNGLATFRLDLPRRVAVEITVHDAAGRRVALLAQGERDAGSHVIAWDGRDAHGVPVAAGVYFVRLRSAELTATEKIVRVR
ncbi:MAG: S8 family serine peptidase [bacterium]